MFPLETLTAYLLAATLIVLSPGPDNLLVVSRGLSQGRLAALLSALGASVGVLCHALGAAFGLTLLVQSSPALFWLVKAVGAGYLIWLGFKALTTQHLISFRHALRQPLGRVFWAGLLTNLLNPKVGLFVLAFVPQFIDARRGPVYLQMLAFGAIYACITALLFSLLGLFAARLSAWLQQHPQLIKRLNLGAGAAFVLAGLSILVLEHQQ